MTLNLGTKINNAMITACQATKTKKIQYFRALGWNSEVFPVAYSPAAKQLS